MKDRDKLNLHGTDDRGNPVIIPLFEDDQVTPNSNAHVIIMMLTDVGFRCHLSEREREERLIHSAPEGSHITNP